MVTEILRAILRSLMTAWLAAFPYLPLALILSTMAACEKDEWSPPSALVLPTKQEPILTVSYPSDYGECAEWFHYDRLEWGWFRARINGRWYTGPAALSKSPTEPGRWYLSYIAIDYDDCFGAFIGHVGDLSADPNDPYAGLPWPTDSPGCGIPPAYPPIIRKERVQSLSSHNKNENSESYLPDTTAGLTLQVVIDDLQPLSGFAQGRFVGHYMANPNCPDIRYPYQNIYVEKGYFEAVLRGR